MVVAPLQPETKMELVKTVMGGIVARNMRITCFLEPKMYLELVNEAKVYGITAKNDSQLIVRVLHKFISDMPMLILQIESLKKAVAEKNSIIDDYQIKVREISVKKVKE